MQGLGYKEILSYLDGTWSLEEAVYVLKRDTRHFAKRQITWFKRERQVEWFDKQEFGYDSQAILDTMLASLREKKISSEREKPIGMKYICKINHKIYERTEQKIMDTAITKEMYKENGNRRESLFFRYRRSRRA